MAKPSLRDRWRDWRTGLIARPGFQRFAARFPLTRPIAAANAEALFSIVGGFVRSQTLYACVDLGVFEALQRARRTTQALAADVGLRPQAAERLFRAAAAIRLLRQGRDGLWRLDDFGAVVAGDAGLQAMIRHHAMLYRDLTDPVGLLREANAETETKRFWAYAGGQAPSGAQPEAVSNYSRLMASSQAMINRNVLDAYPFGRVRRLMDIGGGDGAFLEAAAERHPDMEVMLFDLPAASELAKARFARAGLSARASAHSGDFFADRLPEGADCVVLSRVVCDHDDRAVLTLLLNVRRAMAPGATLLIAEPFAEDTSAGRAVSNYFSWYFLAMGQGRCRSEAEVSVLLRQAGFGAVKRRATASPLLSGLLTAATAKNV